VCVCMCVRVRVPASWSASSYMTMQMRKQFSVWTARQLLVCVRCACIQVSPVCAASARVHVCRVCECARVHVRPVCVRVCRWFVGIL